MPILDILSPFLLVLLAVLYVPAAYYPHKLAAGKGERRLCLRPNIVDDLLANRVSLSMAIAPREINKLFVEIFKPIQLLVG